MADDFKLTPLNFNSSVTGKTILDKKAGVEIAFGYISGLPQDFMDYLYYNKGMALGLSDRGISQEILDRNCRKLGQDCSQERLEVLITKSDLPFDSRWYWIGDLAALFDRARRDRMHLPISKFLFDDILRALGLR